MSLDDFVSNRKIATRTFDKRGIIGQYHKVSAKHLNKYIHEFAFRYNNRDVELAFNLTLQKAVIRY